MQNYHKCPTTLLSFACFSIDQRQWFRQ